MSQRLSTRYSPERRQASISLMTQMLSALRNTPRTTPSDAKQRATNYRRKLRRAGLSANQINDAMKAYGA